jgi:hypothetical protein
MYLPTLHQKRQYTILCALALFLILVFIMVFRSTVLAESTGYEIPWWTVDGGGGFSSDSSGAYTLNGTAGQPDAVQRLSGGGYSLSGGFWASPSAQWQVYLPVILR